MRRCVGERVGVVGVLLRFVGEQVGGVVVCCRGFLGGRVVLVGLLRRFLETRVGGAVLRCCASIERADERRRPPLAGLRR